MSASTFEIVIKPRRGWQPVDVREVWVHRELLGFLIWRDLKIRYKQTLLGGIWAVLQPLFAMLVFTVFFHRLAGLHSDGPPYALFVYSGLVAWTFFANSVSGASNSLIGNQHLISKVYFPRIFIPIAHIGALLLDMTLSLGLAFAMLLYYRWPLTLNLLALPIFIVGTILAATGVGLTFSALNVNFRDMKYAVPFLIQMGIFVTPVIYPIHYVPERLQYLLGLNPMTGMVLGFRYALLGTPVVPSIVLTSFATCVCVFIAGLLIFRRMELRFADII